MLAPIASYSKYARQRGDAALTRTALEKTSAASLRLAELCSKLLAMASNDAVSTSSPLSPNPSKALLPVITESVDCLGRDLAKDGITLTLDVAAELTARFHPPALQQVLFNLLLNARQAMLGRAGRLTIAARPYGERVEITVADSGPGIKPDIIGKIFEPFFSTKRHEPSLDRGGVGLGLHVCRQIMTDLGGSISVASRVGQGATFTLTLPAS
jgi:signal transduction histidine kinase